MNTYLVIFFNPILNYWNEVWNGKSFSEVEAKARKIAAENFPSNKMRFIGLKKMETA